MFGNEFESINIFVQIFCFPFSFCCLRFPPEIEKRNWLQTEGTDHHPSDLPSSSFFGWARAANWRTNWSFSSSSSYCNSSFPSPSFKPNLQEKMWKIGISENRNVFFDYWKLFKNLPSKEEWMPLGEQHVFVQGGGKGSGQTICAFPPIPTNPIIGRRGNEQCSSSKKGKEKEGRRMDGWPCEGLRGRRRMCQIIAHYVR